MASLTLSTSGESVAITKAYFSSDNSAPMSVSSVLYSKEFFFEIKAREE